MSHLTPPPPTAKQAAAAGQECRQVARGHYENFLVASVLLPRAMRQPFFNIYAFCRMADDIADESGTPEDALLGIHHFREQIRRIYEGGTLESIFVAVAHTVAEFDLPREPFDDLLDAFTQDQSVQRYENDVQLREYCRRSANPVGRLVLAMARSDEEDNLRLSDQICTGLQLANFWQDVARDFGIGRIYLPNSVMQSHGFDESVLRSAITNQQPTPSPVRNAIEQQCVLTREMFELGKPLTQRVPRWLAADLSLFIEGGLATLDAIAKIDYDVLSQRVRVGKMRQAWLLSKVVFRSKLSALGLSSEPSRLPQTIGGDA